VCKILDTDLQYNTLSFNLCFIGVWILVFHPKRSVHVDWWHVRYAYGDEEYLSVLLCNSQCPSWFSVRVGRSCYVERINITVRRWRLCKQEMKKSDWWRLWWGLAEYVFGRSLESGCRLCVGEFGNKVFAMKIFSSLIYFVKYFVNFELSVIFDNIRLQ
jgi:hypothetical protein